MQLRRHFFAITGLLLVAACQSARREGGDGSSQPQLIASAGAPSVDHARAGKLVVLGSSTAAGTGPRDPDNAFVKRYGRFLATEFPHFELVNLAVGGQTTYHVQASGFVPPAGRPTPAFGHNITAALAVQPNGIILTLPSNDSAAAIPAAEQLDNYQRIAELARAARVPLWISTTQPRELNDAQLALQRDVRATILRLYAPRVLEFWTPFATSRGLPRAEYAAGDGVHLNDQAHAVLFEIMRAAHIPEHVLSETLP